MQSHRYSTHSYKIRFHCMKKCTRSHTHKHTDTITHRVRAIGHNQCFHLSICFSKHLSLPLCASPFSHQPLLCIYLYVTMCVKERELCWRTIYCTVWKKKNLFPYSPFAFQPSIPQFSPFPKSLYSLLSFLSVSAFTVCTPHSVSWFLYVSLPQSLSLFLLCHTAGKPTLSSFSCSLLLLSSLSLFMTPSNPLSLSNDSFVLL